MSNALINERSPYLKQHAQNPVDWLPWGEAAFEKARREDKPVFLSIGYSTCHWCHVMARESFENKALAEILNHYYVSVKVDREERPDIDSVYMKVCTALNGSGGWPLTVIMTPEQQPFFVGTYLPRESSGGRMGLRELLLTVADKWRSSRAELTKTAGELTAWLRQRTAPSAAVEFSALAKAAEAQLEESYDEEYGGFGTAPKFPSAHNLIFLMEYAQLKNEKKPRQMVENTLRQMINETCIAELTHFLLCFTGLVVFWLWPGAGGLVVWLIYCIFGNLPFIIIQRYNRPRLLRLLRRFAGKEKEK